MAILDFIILSISLAVLVKASDWFVDAAERIASYLNISSYIIGFTLVAIGTSLPELVSSIGAVLLDSTDLLLGNIIGSNIANIALILGVASTIGIIANIQKRVFYREGLFLLGISALTFVFGLNGTINFFEGTILVLLFIAYTSYIIHFNPFKKLYSIIPLMMDFIEIKILHRTKIQKRKQRMKHELYKYKKKWPAIIKQIAIIIASGILMILAVKFLIPAAKSIALSFNISETIVGITILALGTSLPELIVGISSVRKGFGDLLVGTIIGSNISNILLVGGISAMIGNIGVSMMTAFYYIPFMIIVTLALLLFIKLHWELRRRQGIIFLITYVAFIISLYLLR